MAGTGGDQVAVWTTDPTERDVAALAADGLAPVRHLHQMRRPLPYDGPVAPAPTRPFEPARDADAWLAVNNAAFAWHPEQGGWTRERLERALDDDWVDLDGFRVQDDPATGAMVGFCWTKVHPRPTSDPAVDVGEIYVIAVDPARSGGGRGAALTVAGLDWLWNARRTPIGMLYVEATNGRAIATYERLGFAVAHERVGFGPAGIGPAGIGPAAEEGS